MTNETKQTAVEWLLDWMGKHQYFMGNDLLQAFEQAKEMEKEQIKKAYYTDCVRRQKPLLTLQIPIFITFEQYYNETYGGKDL